MTDYLYTTRLAFTTLKPVIFRVITQNSVLKINKPCIIFKDTVSFIHKKHHI